MATSPTLSQPPRTKDANSRTLPGLHELLSPSLRQDPTTSSSYPPSLPPPLASIGRTDPGNYHLPSAPGHPPHAHSQPWQPGPPHTLGPRPSYATESPQYRAPAPSYLHHASHHSTHPSYPPPHLYPQAYPPHPPPGPYIPHPAGPEYRNYHCERPDERRRDSARASSNSNVECVGKQLFPGRGLCYVFNNGDSCPTVIDGEVVNPMWGLTKAGKARKRLAQACLNCREKKIRCEPRQPRCLQCEKSKRECIMPSMQQTQEMSMSPTGGNILPAITPASTSPPAKDVSRGYYPAKHEGSNERYEPAPSGYMAANHAYHIHNKNEVRGNLASFKGVADAFRDGPRA